MQENKIKSLQEIRESRCTKGYEQGDNAMPTDDHLVTKIDSIWDNSWEATEEGATDTRLGIRPALTSLLTMPNSKTPCNMSNNKIKHRIQPCTKQCWNARSTDLPWNSSARNSTFHSKQVSEIQTEAETIKQSNQCRKCKLLISVNTRFTKPSLQHL